MTTETAGAAGTVTGPGLKRLGKFALLRKPGLELARPWGAPRFVVTEAVTPPAGLQFYVRRGVGHGWVDARDGMPELRDRGTRVMRTVAYAMWLEGATIEKIARDFGWEKSAVHRQLQKAKGEMSTLKVVHEAVSKLDRLGVPMAVDAVLKAIEGGDTEAAFRLLQGRQVLASARAGGGGQPGAAAEPGDGPAQVFAGVQVVIKHADGSTVQMGTVVGQPLAGPEPIVPIDGDIVG